MKDSLPEYAAGSLPGPQRLRVERHLAGCATCRTDLAAWLVLAEAAGVIDPARPVIASAGTALTRAVLARSGLTGQVPPPRRRRLPPALVIAEARLVRPASLVASALIVAFGVVLATAQQVPGAWAGQVLALITPVVAAAGVAGAYRPGRDPAFELVAATPTAPRLLLLIRVTLIFGYNLVLASAAAGVLTAVGAEPAGLPALIAACLGPMALLSAVSLVLAVRLDPDIAVGVVLTLWALRVLADSPLVDAGWLSTVVRAVWSTSPAAALVSAVLVVVAVILAGRGEPVRLTRATHLS